MADALLGRKIGMTQIFSRTGARIPVTVITAGPCVVVRKKTVEKDGYTSLQLGYDEIPPAKATKSIAGNCKAAGRIFRIFREVRDGDSSVEVGKTLTVGIFKAGDVVSIVGTSKGKGFAGVVKRHHFAGGPASHGSMFHRAPGSMGMHTFPGRTLKGKRLMGHMGSARVTVKRAEVILVDESQNLLAVRGSVPGARRSLLVVKKHAG